MPSYAFWDELRFWAEAHRDLLAGHKKNKRALYNTWHGMYYRCYNKNSRDYKNYGGRGIGICRRWKESFENFYTDMWNKPVNTTLDRIDNDGDYSPENCRWTTWTVQSRNRRGVSKNEGAGIAEV